METSMRRLVMLLLAASLLTLAGCAKSGTTPGADTGGINLPPMTISRTGGIAGVMDTLQIEPNGQWSLTSRGSTPEAGQLDVQAADQITELLANPGLDAEIAAAAPNSQCADQFRYRVRLSGREFAFDDCGNVGPLLTDLLGILRAETGF
jgi:hypothetical protein